MPLFEALIRLFDRLTAAVLGVLVRARLRDKHMDDLRDEHVEDRRIAAYILKYSNFLVVLISVGLAQARPNDNNVACSKR